MTFTHATDDDRQAAQDALEEPAPPGFETDSVFSQPFPEGGALDGCSGKPLQRLARMSAGSSDDRLVFLVHRLAGRESEPGAGFSKPRGGLSAGELFASEARTIVLDLSTGEVVEDVERGR